MISVILSISLHTSFSCAYTTSNQLVARDTATSQNQDGKPQCTAVSDDDPKTNLINCVEDQGSMDLNDCLMAGQIMIQNGWNSTGYGLCGVLYWGRDSHGSPEPLVPYKFLTKGVIKNTLNSYAISCCPEVTPKLKGPIVDNLPLDPRGRTVFCSGRVRSLKSPYKKPTHLTEKDIEFLIKQNEANYPPPSN
ncbi:secreted protein [Melampsora americana]|nr:secreted protein [Melampsora americana]